MPACEECNLVVVPPCCGEIFEIQPTQGNYIHGYLLNVGYFEEILDWHNRNPQVPLRFFWDKKDAEEETKIDDNLIMYRLNDELFLQSLAGCMAYATTAGFESICEALYYRKPTLMIPVHIEQEFNAYDAGLSGAGIGSKKFDLDKLLDFILIIVPTSIFRNGCIGPKKYLSGKFAGNNSFTYSLHMKQSRETQSRPLFISMCAVLFAFAVVSFILFCCFDMILYATGEATTN